MKSANQIKKSLMGVSEEEKNNIEAIMKDLDSIRKSKEVTEDTVRKLTNIQVIVSSLKDNYMWRLLSAAKQNHML